MDPFTEGTVYSGAWITFLKLDSKDVLEKDLTEPITIFYYANSLGLGKIHSKKVLSSSFEY